MTFFKRLLCCIIGHRWSGPAQFREPTRSAPFYSSPEQVRVTQARYKAYHGYCYRCDAEQGPRPSPPHGTITGRHTHTKPYIKEVNRD